MPKLKPIVLRRSAASLLPDYTSLVDLIGPAGRSAINELVSEKKRKKEYGYDGILAFDYLISCVCFLIFYFNYFQNFILHINK